MPVIFKGNPGRVLAIKDPAVESRIRPLVQPEPTIDIQGEKSIITNVVIAQQTNHQFLHTLGNDIFIYVFGDRVGQLSSQGFSFPETCEAGPGGEGGLELILNWYKRHKLSSQQEPVKIAIGQITFTGFVQGINTEVAEPKTWLTRFVLNIAIIPEKNDEGNGGGGGGGGGNGGGGNGNGGDPSGFTPPPIQQVAGQAELEALG